MMTFVMTRSWDAEESLIALGSACAVGSESQPTIELRKTADAGRTIAGAKGVAGHGSLDYQGHGRPARSTVDRSRSDLASLLRVAYGFGRCREDVGR